MSFLKFKPTGLVAVVTLGLCAQLVPGTLEAQRGLRLGQPGALIGGSDVAGSVLDNAEEMDLTPGQVERLEALQANSEARVGAAREQLEGWRAELPMIREASESIRSDVRATMAELRTILNRGADAGARAAEPGEVPGTTGRRARVEATARRPVLAGKGLVGTAPKRKRPPVALS